MPSREKLEAEGPVARRAVGIVAADLLRERLHADESCVVWSWFRKNNRGSSKFTLSACQSRRLSLCPQWAHLLDLPLPIPSKSSVILRRGPVARGTYSPVPFIADSISDKQIFMSQRVFKQTLALAEQASFYIVTLGQCDEYSLLFRHRLLSGIELQDLKRAGAVCDCMGKFFDADGQVVSSDLNQRTLAVDLEYLYEREVILLCAGQTEA